jgi:hypothetical protein
MIKVELYNTQDPSQYFSCQKFCHSLAHCGYVTHCVKFAVITQQKTPKKLLYNLPSIVTAVVNIRKTTENAQTTFLIRSHFKKYYNSYPKLFFHWCYQEPKSNSLKPEMLNILTETILNISESAYTIITINMVLSVILTIIQNF